MLTHPKILDQTMYVGRQLHETQPLPCTNDAEKPSQK